MNNKKLKTKKHIKKLKNRKIDTVFKKNHCSLKNSKNEDSCLDNRLLIKIGNILNDYHNSDININTSRKLLHKQISKKLSDISECNSEKCWLTIQELIRHLSFEELKVFRDSFKPKKPQEWDKNPNAWLTTSQLDLILDQLQNKYTNFKHYGALPMDFEKRNGDSCISGNLCDIDLKTHLDSNQNVGTIFNLDDHDEPGSHWTAIYIELIPKCREVPSIYYFDSIGNRPPKEIYDLSKKLKQQYKSIKNEELDFLYNDIQHQQGNTECGIYSLHFLETMLKGMKFNDYIKNKNNDSYIEKFRNYYFINE